jgi:hypothetical protein
MIPKILFLLIAQAIMCPSTGIDHSIIKPAMIDAKLIPINGAMNTYSKTNPIVIRDPQAIIAVKD